MKGTYDEISKRVNEEISKLGKSGTFADRQGSSAVCLYF